MIEQLTCGAKKAYDMLARKDNILFAVSDFSSHPTFADLATPFHADSFQIHGKASQSTKRSGHCQVLSGDTTRWRMYQSGDNLLLTHTVYSLRANNHNITRLPISQMEDNNRSEHLAVSIGEIDPHRKSDRTSMAVRDEDILLPDGTHGLSVLPADFQKSTKVTAKIHVGRSC